MPFEFKFETEQSEKKMPDVGCKIGGGPFLN